MQMDHLGPLVMGDDGSVSRIANWDKLTEREREVRRSRLAQHAELYTEAYTPAIAQDPQHR